MVILILFLIGQNGDRDYLCLLVRPLFYSEYSGFKFKFTGFERVCVCVCVYRVFQKARSQYSEGPATGHLDTGFSWFPCA